MEVRKMKKIIILIMILMSASLVFAHGDYNKTGRCGDGHMMSSGHIGGEKMMNYGMMGSWKMSYMFVCLLWVLLGAFVFSAIFWLTYKWLIIGCDKKNKRKK
jgi:hypothetical protein